MLTRRFMRHLAALVHYPPPNTFKALTSRPGATIFSSSKHAKYFGEERRFILSEKSRTTEKLGYTLGRFSPGLCMGLVQMQRSNIF